MQVARVARNVAQRGRGEIRVFFVSAHAQSERLHREHPPMDVSDDGDGCLNVDDVALAHQELLCLFANLFEERLSEELFPQQDRDGAIEVEHAWL